MHRMSQLLQERTDVDSLIQQLHHFARSFSSLGRRGMQHYLGCLIEYSGEVPACLGGALQVQRGTHNGSCCTTILKTNRRHVPRRQLLHNFWVLSKVQFGSDQQQRCVGAVVSHFANPLSLGVVQGGGRHKRETDENDICQRVGERSHAIIVALPGCVPQRQLHGTPVDNDVGAEVVEDGRHVLLREGVFGEGRDETSLPDSTVSNHHALDF